MTTNRLSALVLVAMLAGAASLKAQSNPISADAKTDYASIKAVLLQAAANMPEENYGFRAMPKALSYGEMIAHVADTQMDLCAIAKGEQKKGNAAGKISKGDLSAALKTSFAYCDPVYDSLTDAGGAKVVNMYSHDRSKLGVLFFNVEHDNDIYGQMVAYMRIKGIMPESTEGKWRK